MQNGSAPVPEHAADSPPEVALPEVALAGMTLPEMALPEAEPDQPAPTLRASLEAILLVADEPIPVNVIAQVVERSTDEVSAALAELAESYTADGRGFELSEIAGGWRFYTRAECAAIVERFVRDGQEVRLTQAALETLSVVAYRQPVSRARVSAVRGVNCDGVMRTLVLRGLTEEAGTDPETGAILFQTTSYFLERLGLASLADLPELAPFLPDHLDDEQDAGHEHVGS
jgi:segregation and condensation protein B